MTSHYPPRVDFDTTLRMWQLAIKEAPNKIREQAGAAIKTAIEVEIDNQFATGRDPYGKPYPPAKDGHLPPMIRTGRLRRGVRVRLVKRGTIGLTLIVSDEAPYAIHLQRSGRRIVPDGALPRKWRMIFDTAYSNALVRWYAGRR